jgi:hypothetical protein
MKKAMPLLHVLGLILLITGFTACKKYDEGGLISKTEKNLKNNWKLVQYLKNGVDKTSTLLISNYLESYADNGIYSRSYTDKNGAPVSDDGRWIFSKDEKKLNISDVGSIEITLESGTVSSSYFSILKLDKNDYWYFFTNGGANHEFHFVKN